MEDVTEDATIAMRESAPAGGPPELDGFAHVSLPCRDLAEGKRFWLGVMGGRLRVDHPEFAAIIVAGTEIGIGTEGCAFVPPGAEYPHIAFYCSAQAMRDMKAWLARCGIPSSNYWTRAGVEALMFFRDPSGNLVELFCTKGFDGADRLPKGPPRGHGIAVDIDALRYERWSLPAG